LKTAEKHFTVQVSDTTMLNKVPWPVNKNGFLSIGLFNHVVETQRQY
jgi:hypothetical protein